MSKKNDKAEESTRTPVNPKEFMDMDVDVEAIGGIDEYLEGGPAVDADGAPDDQGTDMLGDR